SHGESFQTLPANVTVHKTCSALYRNSLARSLWEQILLPVLIRKHSGYDILINLTNSAPVFLSPGIPQVLLLHDVSFRNTRWFSRSFSAYLTWVFHRAITRGIQLVTVSNTSAAQIAEMFPTGSKVHVIPNDADHPGEVVKAREVGYRYGLFLGSLNPRKNLDGAISGFQNFIATTRDDLRLVVVGAEKQIFARAKQAKFDNIVFRGYVDDLEKWELLRGADFLLFPSFLEGFGIPILEAMRVGTPVVASDIPVFRELFEDAVEYVDPHSPADIGRGIRELHGNVTKREWMIMRGLEVAKKFSWTRAAQNYIQLFAETVKVRNLEHNHRVRGK
ncbi:MAG: glycosyltransferase family 4 protein, partial [Nitrososphaera sp.]|nr:glycosyltransferase family 4 protein [Nitrososphaera sp.]